MEDCTVTSSVNLSVEETEPGCCHQLLQSFANIIHLVDLVGGCILLGYGIAITLHNGGGSSANDHDEALAVIEFLVIIWGALLLLASLTGVFGFTSPKCRRFGLVISGYIGLVISVWNCVLVLYWLVEKKHAFQYLKWSVRRNNELYLSEKEIDGLEKNFVAWILSLVIFAAGEVGRFYLLQQLRPDLLAHDMAKENERRHNTRRRRNEDQRQWESNHSINHTRNIGRNDNDDDFEDTSRTPLLTNEHVFDPQSKSGNSNNNGNDDDNLFQVASTNTSWWEEPLEESSGVEQKQTNTSWLSRVWNKEPKNATTTSTKSGDLESNDNINEDADASSVDEFAPVDEDLDLNMTLDSSSPNRHDDWSREGTSEKKGDDGPDLSWAEGR